LVDLMAEAGIASSKGDARRSIDGGGVYVNNVRVEDAGRALTMEDTIEGRFLLVRKGKKRYHLVAVR
jgi:tyrosyl-tRNA synthetase